MFPKLIKNAKMEDVQKENPKLYQEIVDHLSTDLSATLQMTHKDSMTALESKVSDLETQLAVLNSEKTILMAGINGKQGVLAQALIAEGKSEFDALCEISDASKSLESFVAGAPKPAGNGGASDVQDIDTQAKAIEAVLAANPGMSRVGAIKLARRQYTSLFVSQTLINHSEKRN
jgi:hypothetical protein